MPGDIALSILGAVVAKRVRPVLAYEAVRAIGSNKSVTPRLYVYYKPGLVSGLFGGNPFYSPYYPGDADLGLDAVAKEGATTHGLINPKPDNVKGENSYLYYKDKTNGVENGKYKLANVNLSDDNILTGLLKGVGGLLGTLLGGLTVGTGEFCGVNEKNGIRSLLYSRN